MTHTVGIEWYDIPSIEDLNTEGVVVEVGPHRQDTVLSALDADLLEESLRVVHRDQLVCLSLVVLEPLLNSSVVVWKGRITSV